MKKSIYLLFFVLFGILGCKPNVKTVTLESIVVKTPATKTEYCLNEELDITGLEIVGIMSNGKEEKIDSYEIDFDSSVIGDSIIVTIKYSLKETFYTVKVKNHEFGDWIELIKATEESEGLKHRFCNSCGIEESQIIPQLTHTHTIDETEWAVDKDYHWHKASCGRDEHNQDLSCHIKNSGVITTQATCTANGIKTFNCTVCNYEMETEEIPALGHNEDNGKITLYPTCMVKGKRTYTCSRCSKKRNEEIDSLGLCESPIDAQTLLPASENSEFVYFGVMPRSIVPADSTITIDDKKELKMGSKTYYKGSDGEYYEQLKVNLRVYCSENYTYKYTDGSLVKYGETRLFKVEPIKWKIISKNYNGTKKALLLSDEIVTANIPFHKYNSEKAKRSVCSNHNCYEHSQIRAYLNGLIYWYDASYSYDTYSDKSYEGKGFLQTVFTDQAQDKIVITKVDNSHDSSIDSQGKLEGCASPDTNDKIFLLSEREVTSSEYGFSTSYSAEGPGNARIKFPSDYAIANYCFRHYKENYGGSWWLRSSSKKGEYRSYARGISDAGYADKSYSTTDRERGIVPALCIDLNR